MNFFERQTAARKSSNRLVFLFLAAILSTAALFSLALLIASGGEAGFESLVFGALLAGGTMLAAYLFKVAQLGSGGAQVAQQMGGSRVSEDTQDFHLQRLRNVVEEVAIASGVPVPEIYVLEHEAGINAFAAGYSTADAAVAVTRGALDRLNREELQGVIAHEFSHILNGDMRLNIRLMGGLFGIMVLALIGRKILMHERCRNHDYGVGAGCGRLYRCVLWQADQGRCQSSARIPCRCVSCAVHPADERLIGRIKKNRWAERRCENQSSRC